MLRPAPTESLAYGCPIGSEPVGAACMSASIALWLIVIWAVAGFWLIASAFRPGADRR